jgi:hypothetical protein
MRTLFLTTALLAACGLGAAVSADAASAADMPVKAKRPQPVAVSRFWIEADYL